MREGLVYNYEDDCFTWMDASVDRTTDLLPVACMRYQFNVGWQTRWVDLLPGGASEALWSDLNDTPWSDFLHAGTEESMHWLTDDGVYVSDQFVKTDGIKEYFLDRDRIDLNDVVQAFTTDQWIHAKQMYFHMASPSTPENPNPFEISVGWSNTLMDDPDFLPATVINLQDRLKNGRVKYDFRSTGRYLALKMRFNGTAALKMTSAEIDVEQVHGR